MMKIKTFTAPMGNADKCDREVNDFIESLKSDNQIINIRTATNDYRFYITVIYNE